MTEGWAIGDAATVRGFELAGFRAIVAETSAEVRTAVGRARTEGVRLVVLCGPAADLPAEVPESAPGAPSTLLVVVPELANEQVAPAHDRIRRAVRSALGVPEGRRA